MKKTVYRSAFVLMLSLATITSQATVTADDNGKDKVALMSKDEKLVRLKAIEIRVNEIKTMDKSTLTRSEKKELRHELRDMRKETRALENRGVYLSVGAIIIIILLLILIL